MELINELSVIDNVLIGAHIDFKVGGFSQALRLPRAVKEERAMRERAMVKDKATGERHEVSKIVAQLQTGAAVSLSRNDVDLVVTEYGVADLRGANINQRVYSLIEIAHPKFRDELLDSALTAGIIGRK